MFLKWWFTPAPRSPYVICTDCGKPIQGVFAPALRSAHNCCGGHLIFNYNSLRQDLMDLRRKKKQSKKSL